MDRNAKIYVPGHRGLVGSAIVRRLRAEGYENIVNRTSAELDLREQAAVRDFFATEKPDYVFLAAAKVGGIHANATYPAEFIRDNLLIETNIIDAAYVNNCTKLQFLGSSCIYPKFAPQPMTEDCLLTSELESSNEWYAIAKIAGIKLCQAYRKQYGFDCISLMPTNLYGPGDNFHPENSHVIAALMRRFHEAKEAQVPSVTVWGTGTPRREFLHVDDLAAACVFLMQNYSGEDIVNVGVGHDVTIREMAETVARAVGYEGELTFDTTKPDGTPRKLLDVSRLDKLGWHATIGFEDGLRETYQWFLEHQDDFRR